MDTDTPTAQESEYGSSPWVDIGAFESPAPHHSPPLPEFHGFSYAPSSIMPMEPAYNISVSPPYSTISFTMPPPSAWPNMLAAHGHYPPDTTLPPASTPAQTISAPQPVPIRPLRATPAPHVPTPRRTLTDEDRRRMCLYHEENKTAKQTDIGALFGVERSTVSKVLRQKEKYLSMEDGSRSPIKKNKGKVPDIEKALANWAKNYQRQGFNLTDAMIKEKAHFFATTCASQDGKHKILTASWLEKFKQKNHLSGSKSRKNSTDTVVSDGGESVSRLQSPTETQLKSTGVSPISPTGLMPSPLSPTQGQDKLKKEPSDSFFDFSMDQSKHSHSQSTTSLDTIPSLSGGIASPTSPLLSGSPLTPTMRSSRLPSISSATSRPRSQTFPLLSSDTESNGNGGHADSKRLNHGSLPVSVVTSPLDLGQQKQLGDDNISPRDSHSTTTIKRDPSTPDMKSPTSMQPPPIPASKPTVSSPVSSSSPTGSSQPTQDEARRALELLMSYIQSQSAGLGLQASDYTVMAKLMEKLDLVPSQSSSSMILGKLHRIDEDADADVDVDVDVDLDVGMDGPHIDKKTSIPSMA